jgi:hypothetical protein
MKAKAMKILIFSIKDQFIDTIIEHDNPINS